MAILKRLAAPRWWRIPRKVAKFIVAPRPGPHSKEECLPLAVLIRDYLRLAENLKEAKRIIKSRFVKVNGVVRTDHKFPVGLMDVIEIGNPGEEGYIALRCVPSKHGFEFKEVKDVDKRLIRIDDKRYVRKGKVQLNFHNGENMLIEPEEQGKYATGDVLLIETKTKRVLQHLKLKPGALALVVKGANRGKLAKVVNVEKTKTMKGTLVEVEIEGRKIKLPKKYVFVVGEAKPVIEI